MVSDRAKALRQLAGKGLGCLGYADFFPRIHGIVEGLWFAFWQPRAPRAAGMEESQGGPATPPGRPPRGEGYPRGPGVGGSEASRSDTLGRGAPQLSRSRGAPLAVAPFLPSVAMAESAVCAG